MNRLKIFDPFFATEEKEMGLSLSVVYKIVNQHNNRKAGFNADQGTKFVLTLQVDETLRK